MSGIFFANKNTVLKQQYKLRSAIPGIVVIEAKKPKKEPTGSCGPKIQKKMKEESRPCKREL